MSTRNPCSIFIWTLAAWLGGHPAEAQKLDTVKIEKLTGLKGTYSEDEGGDKDPALVLMGRIVNGADTDNSLWHQPEGPGLQAIAEGFRHLGLKDDHAINAAERIVYDALYAYCREMVHHGKVHGAFK
jgi:hypothetical protein